MTYLLIALGLTRGGSSFHRGVVNVQNHLLEHYTGICPQNAVVVLV